jgi:hypothetical protein
MENKRTNRQAKAGHESENRKTRTVMHAAILSRSKARGEHAKAHDRMGKASEGEAGMLVAVKVVHTVVWALLAGAIVALPFLAVQAFFGWAAIFSVVIVVEGVVLLANGWRCPLTDLAAKYTDDRSPSFDIYMPNWLARHNKTIFTVLFLVNETIVVVEWLREPVNCPFR